LICHDGGEENSYWKEEAEVYCLLEQELVKEELQKKRETVVEEAWTAGRHYLDRWDWCQVQQSVDEERKIDGFVGDMNSAKKIMVAAETVLEAVV